MRAEYFSSIKASYLPIEIEIEIGIQDKPMQKKVLKFLSVVSSAMLLGCAPSMDTSSDYSAEQFTVEYEKYTLDNGLEVILHVDKSDPIVAVSTVVHVGSSREKPGKTGFAHFFEHMAFNDSENVPRHYNRTAIAKWGGARNGGTWRDGTRYYEVVPKDAFDKILWIDSDRLGYMVNTVTQAALDREKEVVKNEKRQRNDNAPYGHTREVFLKTLYPDEHPYSWPVIGSIPDLQSASLEDLREFYYNYYGAANVTLAISGDIDIEETKQKVERWFGEIRRGPDVQAPTPMPVKLEETKSVFFEDNFAKLPELRIVFPTVEKNHEDEVALNVLSRLLAGGKNSVIYQEVVEKGELAPQVSSANNSMELAGEFLISVRGAPEVDLDHVKVAIDAALARFEKEGVNLFDLRKIKVKQEISLYSEYSTVLKKANKLARDNEMTGDPVNSIRQARAIKDITADDVMTVFQKYIKGKPAIITSFVPKGEPQLAVSGAEPASVWIEEVKPQSFRERVKIGAEAAYEKTPSKYDRSEPPFTDLPLFKSPKIWDMRYENRNRLIGITNTEIPIVLFNITLDGGTAREPRGKEGVANLLARVLKEGSARKSAAEMEQALGLLGASLSVRAGVDEVSIRVSTLASNFEETVSLITEIIETPSFKEKNLERARADTITILQDRQSNSGSIANLAFRKVLYGENHPLGRSTLGNKDNIESISLEDLELHHHQILQGQAIIHVTGNVSEKRAIIAFEKVASLFGGANSERKSVPIASTPGEEKVFFIDVPGSKQSVLYVGNLALAPTHEDANKLDFANSKLGGGLEGDLGQTLRIRKGYTYGASSRIEKGLNVQPFRISTSVRANATKDSLDTIRDIIKNYGSRFTEEHVVSTQQKLLKRTARTYEDYASKLGILRSITKYGKSKAYIEERQQELLEMSLEDYRRVITEYLNEDAMIYVVVGDKETQFDLVSEFANGKVIEFDTQGNVLSKATTQ